MKAPLAILLLGLALAGCSTTASTPPGPSATDQLLPNHSAEAVARKLDLRLKPGSRVYLDTSYCDPADRFLFGAIRAHMLGRGLAMVDRPDADVVVELRVSANGIDAVDKVFGIASSAVPANTVHTGTPAFSIPEISLWSIHRRTGVTEVWAVAYDAHTKRLVAAAGPISAEAKITERRLLSGFSFGQELARPAITAAAQ